MEIWDVHHAHENLIGDAKRYAFAGMVRDEGSFPTVVKMPNTYNGMVIMNANVAASVMEDLGENGNGYVGFLVSSENIDEYVGLQTICMTEFKMEVTFGEAADEAPGSVKLYYPHINTVDGWGAEVCAVNTNADFSLSYPQKRTSSA